MIQVDYILLQGYNIFIFLYRSKMNKFHFSLIFVLMIVSSNCWDLRFLQTYSDPNCAQWSSDGSTCLKCIPRAYNNTQQNKCIRVDDNCKTWNQTNGQCVKCYDSYGDAWKNGNAIDGKCPYYNGPQNNTIPQNETFPQQTPQIFQGYDINCKCFNDLHVCIQCYDQYQLNQQKQCIPIPMPPNINCMTFVNGICQQCIQGYYLNQQSQCFELPANCTEADQNGNCTQCATMFILTQSGQCIPQIMNCTEYDSSGECIQCESGFYLDSQGQCNLLPENCNATNDQGICISCVQGYVVDNQGICQQIPQNCSVTNQNVICIQCAEGFYLDQNQQCQTLPANCTDADSLGKCLKCVEGLVISNGVCVVPSGSNLNCAQQNDMGQCTKCRAFYQLKNGNCIPTGQNPFCEPGSCQCGTGKCLECQAGYFLDNNGICVQISQNCQQYSKFNGSCTSCSNSYQLTNGQCIPSNGQRIIDLNCKTQQNNGTCITCRKYYTLINGECEPTGDNPKCHLWNSKKECVCCYYPNKYYLDNNNICEQKNLNCAQFDIQNGKCTKCQINYTLRKGKCIPSSSGQRSVQQNTKK